MNQGVSESASRLFAAQVRRLKSHPSVVVWSGNNENEAALATDWFHIPPSLRPQYLRDYVTLYVDNIRVLVQKVSNRQPGEREARGDVT